MARFDRLGAARGEVSKMEREGPIRQHRPLQAPHAPSAAPPGRREEVHQVRESSGGRRIQRRLPCPS